MLYAGLNLSIFNAFVVLFLESDLLTTIVIITIIVSSRNFLQIFFRVPMGELSQILGRKPLILFGSFCYTIALGLVAFASDWLLVLVATGFIAIGMSSFWPALFSYIGDVSQDRYGENNGRIFQGGDVGTIFGSFIATYLLNTAGFTLQELFSVIFFLSLVASISLILILPETLLKNQRKKVNNIPLALIYSFTGLRQITFTKGMGIIYIWQLLLSFTEFMVTVFYPVLIISQGFDNGNVTEIALWATIGIIWFKPHMGKISDRYGFERPIAGMLLISGLILIILVYTPHLIILHIVLYAILIAAIITAYTSVNGGIVKTAPAHHRGLALGTLGFYVSFGRTTSSIILGPVWGLFNINLVFLITGLLIIGATLLILGRNLVLQKIRPIDPSLKKHEKILEPSAF